MPLSRGSYLRTASKTERIAYKEEDKKTGQKGNLETDHRKHRRKIIIAPQECCVNQVKYSLGKYFQK